VGAGEEDRVARREPLLEELGDGNGVAALLEGGGAVAHDGELDQPGEKAAWQGEPADDGVVAVREVGKGAELERSGRRQLATREGMCGQVGETRLRATPVDPAHLFAGANVEAPRAEQVAERQARLTRAKVFG
jgi:hypothetical protein